MRRTIIIIIIAIVVIICLTLAWWFFIKEGGLPWGKEGGPAGALPQAGNIPTDGENAPQIGGVSKNSPGFEDEVIKHDLENRSKVFMERLASYSSDSNLLNMSDLYPEMAEELKTAVAGKRLSLLADFEKGGEFSGYTTSVVTSNVSAFDKEAGSATVVMNAQREVTSGGNEPKLEYKNYILSWQRGEGGRWLVNAISGEY